MSQSPLSRAIRELERELGVVLFVRTTRRVELTPAGSLLLERARRALAEIDGAVADVRRLTRSGDGVLRLGYGPFSGTAAGRIFEVLRAERPELTPRLVQEVTPDSLRRVGARELAAAVVMESPAAARRYGVRVDALKDEPLLAALPPAHRYASELGDTDLRVRGRTGARPTRAGGVDVQRMAAERDARARVRTRADNGDRERALGSALAPGGERRGGGCDGRRLGRRPGQRPRRGAVRPAAELSDGPRFAVAATAEVTDLVQTALRVRDSEGWLTERPARTELPED